MQTEENFDMVQIADLSGNDVIYYEFTPEQVEQPCLEPIEIFDFINDQDIKADFICSYNKILSKVPTLTQYNKSKLYRFDNRNQDTIFAEGFQQERKNQPIFIIDADYIMYSHNIVSTTYHKKAVYKAWQENRLPYFKEEMYLYEIDATGLQNAIQFPRRNIDSAEVIVPEVPADKIISCRKVSLNRTKEPRIPNPKYRQAIETKFARLGSAISEELQPSTSAITPGAITPGVVKLTATPEVAKNTIPSETLNKSAGFGGFRKGFLR